MKAKALLAVFLLGMVMFLPAHHPAYACGGGGYSVSLDTVVESAEIIVEATLIETDDAGKNLIVQVAQYLKGSGPAYLLLYRTNPALSATYDGRHYDTGCTYGGAIPLNTGRRGYFALTRQPDGSYRYSEGGAMLETLVWEPKFPMSFDIRIAEGGPDEPDNWVNYEFATEDEFVTWIVDAAQSTRTPPDVANQPRRTPLLITTATGSQYILPIDGGPAAKLETPTTISHYSPYAYPDILATPHFCSIDRSLLCRATSPDGSLIASFAGELEAYINFDYYPYAGEYPNSGRDPNDYNENAVMPITLTGQAFAFSSTGEAFLVWNRGVMSVYRVSNQYCQCTGYGEFAPRLDLMASISPAYDDTTQPTYDDGGVRWSADGTTMTYFDKAGVWIFDLFRMAAPELLVAGSGLKPLFLSASGRYVAYQNLANDIEPRRAEVEWTVLDRLTGVEYANAILSPDERYMAQIAPAVPIEPETSGVCAAPIMTQCPIVLDYVPQRFEWTADSAIYYDVRCSSNGNCDLRSNRADGLTISVEEIAKMPEFHAQITDVAYEQKQGLYAVALQGPSIMLLSPDPIYSDLENQLFELGDVLDGEIVDVAWLPSLFYEEN